MRCGRLGGFELLSVAVVDSWQCRFSRWSGMVQFKETLKKLNNDELVETLNVIDYMREEYYRSKVPSAKEQIENLNQKEDLVASQIEENVKEKDSKGKGKAVDTKDNLDEKGK